jgi:hypothetical protein
VLHFAKLKFPIECPAGGQKIIYPTFNGNFELVSWRASCEVASFITSGIHPGFLSRHADRQQIILSS